MTPPSKVQLIVEPEGGIDLILETIDNATTHIDILIFRLDCRSVTKGLEAAVRRGVAVRAMIAQKNRGGKRDLRKLEHRLLKAGVVLARTAGDLVRYHAKMMIVDRRVLHVYGFNYTRLDYRSRSFGIITTNPALVSEALRLFEADSTRRPYKSGLESFIVSPDNSREKLAEYIRGAQHQLLIYDPKLGDREMHRLLMRRADHGVDVRIIGKTRGLRSRLNIEKLRGVRMHVRAIVRDGKSAFLGSQSLEPHSLDRRREIGVIVSDPEVVHQIRSVFQRDWTLTQR